jgi:hypothetical protein
VLEWSPQRLLGLLALTQDERSIALAALGEAALGAGAERARALESTLVSVLP